MSDPRRSSNRTVVIGLVGSSLDRGKGAKRWESWRPSVALCQHPDLLVDRLELLVQPRDRTLADQVCEDIAAISPETQVIQRSIELDDPWDFEEVYGQLHDLAAQTPFDLEAEDYLLHISTGTHVCQICMFLLAESRHFPARLIQTAPPKRRSTGGPGSYTLIDLDLSRYDRIARRHHREQQEGLSYLKQGIDTRNGAFNALIEQVEKVAIRSREPILLTGPTGAGKSLLARRIYELKAQRRQLQGPLVEVNCATIRGDGAMSALFGHVRGAFTGAVGERKGLLKRAHGGLLFLDEIGELGVEEQAMLLRAVEERRFLPVGADREDESEFQLIAGTNRSLTGEVATGRFRADLLARIDLWTFELPRLSDRREDIEPNLRFELDRFADRANSNVRFNREARRRFLDFATAPDTPWLGNFRDLNAAVTRMSTLAPGGRISRDVVDEEIGRLRRGWQRPEDDRGDARLLAEVVGEEGVAEIDLFDRVQLAQVIRVCRESKSLAAAGRRLFAVSRRTKTSKNDSDRLRKYLARFGLGWDDVTERTTG